MPEFVGVEQFSREAYPEIQTLQDLSFEFQVKCAAPILAAKVNHVVKDLQSAVLEGDRIEFIDMTSEWGNRVYRRSIIFLLITAIHELYGAEESAELTVEHAISNGLYCELYLGRPLTEADVKQIERHMRQIVAEKRAIQKRILPKSEVVALFEQSGQHEKAHLVQSLERDTVSLHYCGAFYDYLYGPLATSTADLRLFALDYYAPGLIVRVPEAADPNRVPDYINQPKLAGIFAEAERWAHILECAYVANLNRHHRQGGIRDLIRVSEALHEKKVAEIADYIAANLDRVRLILIAGPSSSGKTTFAQRLRIQLRVNGVQPISISLDDYFMNREFTPRDARGEYDFECLEALDVKLFNEHLKILFSGGTVEIPYYNFITGEREWRGTKIRLEKNQPVIVEGIHGLNERLTAEIPRSVKYKVYISALTQLAIDGHNRIPTTDTRIIRRMVRDHNSRGANALKTLRQWHSVRSGEEKNIFPYQEEADAMFNSALIYELGVLKKYAEPLLKAVSPDLPEYGEAVRLLDFLTYFDNIREEDEIPRNSILQEFVGNSCFF